MRTAVLRQVRRIEVERGAAPRPAAGEALVELRSVGLCGSDLAAFRGHHPFRSPPVVLGHEGAGRIVRAASAGGPAEGARVAVLPLAACRRCERCESGLAHLCPHRRVPGAGLPGLLAGRVALPVETLVPIDDELTYDEGALIEPAAVAWHTVRAAGVRHGSRVAVLGAGAVGALTAATARLHGAADVLVSDVREAALTLAAYVSGCRTRRVGDVGTEDLTESADTFDAVVVASGHPTCLDEALTLCRPRGTVIVLPMFARPVTAALNPLVLKEIHVRGACLYTPDDFRAAARAVGARTLDVRPLATAEALPLDAAQDVFEAFDGGHDTVKYRLDPSR
ncbi:zinc-binding dehydrogenase [Streptomyces sp. NPDC050400]|uniref:zinc-binding dehydrogenase n=1 Tax=Streptomyces sp. NPDC050400 TaxID=3365610 RepID=UPI0037B8233B